MEPTRLTVTCDHVAAARGSFGSVIPTTKPDLESLLIGVVEALGTIRAARLLRPPITYIRRMYTDTVSPHSMGIKFAIEYYGIERVMYGSDYPCWDPATALALIQEIGLPDADLEKLLYRNAQRILGLGDVSKLDESNISVPRSEIQAR